MKVQKVRTCLRWLYVRYFPKLTMFQSRTYRGGIINVFAFSCGVFFTLTLVSVYQDDAENTLCDLCHEEVRSLTRNFSLGVRRDFDGVGGANQEMVIGLEHDNYKDEGPEPNKVLKGQGDWSSYRYQLDPHSGNVEIVPPHSDDRIFVVTPTYNRPEQLPELTRMAQALLPVKQLVHWLVVEDVEKRQQSLEKFITKFNIRFTLLLSLQPNCTEKVVGRPRGVGARKSAINWLRNRKAQGVLYFADDDNTYDSDIFRQMASTKLVSMWPVGLVTDWGVSSPIIKQGKVVGFYDGWKADRKFAVDMAGFAVNLNLVHAKPTADMPWIVGYEEDGFLKSLGIGFRDIQPLANNCTEILVWHTKAMKNKWARTSPMVLKQASYKQSNLQNLLRKLPRQNAPSPLHSRNDCDGKNFSIMKYFFGL